jgi:hypothetical protein
MLGQLFGKEQKSIGLRVALGQPMAEEQAKQVLDEGKTLHFYLHQVWDISYGTPPSAAYERY